ncbi:MAG: SPOR domain-containing protein [Alphaproteobacteria bacterium]|nr:SPOR domain-containing protein [Alphaproteobacteria bacterium]
MDKDENLDLLDLDDADTSVDDNLPDAAPFVAPRPHRPWLLMGIGLAIIVLAVFIIIRVVGSNSSSSIDVDLGEPIVVGERAVDVVPEPAPVAEPAPIQVVPVPAPTAHPTPMPAPAPMPVVRPEPAPMPQPVAAPVPQDSVRVIQDRKDVTFNPARESAAPKPIRAPAPKQVKTPTKPKPAPKPATQKVSNGGWYVQFGSYSTRSAAESAERKIRSGHANLFNGKQFVILAAVLPNGSTTYRLRVAFATSGDANGFCRNAKSDGLDCYVAK